MPVVETIVGILIGKEAVALAWAVAGNIAANQVGERGAELFGRVRRQLDKARETGRLPSNHHLERATARAGVLASDYCLQRMVDAGAAGALYDVVLSEGQHLSDRYSNEAALASLRTTLAQYARRLEPKAGPSGEAAERRTIEALRNASLPFAAAGLDRTATLALGRINAPDTRVLPVPPPPPPAPEEGVWTTIGRWFRGDSRQAPPRAPSQSPDPQGRTAALTSLRAEVAPDLAETVIAQALRLGGWLPNRQQAVAEALKEAFFGRGENWLTAFALFYAEEQRDDERLNKLSVLLRLDRIGDDLDEVLLGQANALEAAEHFHANLRARFGDMATTVEQAAEHSKEAAEAARTLLNEVRAQFKFEGEAIFYPPGSQGAGGATERFRPFYFAEEEDQFIGRADALASIHERLLGAQDDAVPFRWAAICGNAGSGKSRLALQVLREAGDRWRLSGFVRSEFIKHAELKLRLAAITGPMLFVIDYAGSQPEECRRFVELCALQAQGAPFPVRAILLLRRTNDRFFDLVREERDGAVASRTQVRFVSGEAGVLEANGALVVDRLEPTDTTALMRGRMRQQGAHFSDDQLLSHLRRYDESERPLFALIVADTLAHDTLPETVASDTPEQKRLALLWAYLKHQFLRRWKNTPTEADQNRNALIDRHVSLLLFSTMCRGIAECDWLALLDQDSEHQEAATRLLPIHPRRADAVQGSPFVLKEKTLLAALAGASRADEQALFPILEPDLIGESLVLLMLDRKEGEQIALTERMDQWRREGLRNLAWRADPAGAAFFALLVGQDFPEYAAKWRWLLPDDASVAPADARARLFHSLALTLVSPLQARAAKQSDIRLMRALIDHFADLPHDEAVAYEHASGLARLAAQLAFVINKSKTPKSEPFAPPLQDKQERAGAARAAADSSTAFNQATDNRRSAPGLHGIAYLESDAATVQDAIALVTEIAEPALGRMEQAPSYRVGARFGSVLEAALTSALWVHRADRTRLGMAASAPNEEETALRDAIAEHCTARLRSPDVEEEIVGLFAHAISSVIYAEHGADPHRGDVAFDAIRALKRRGGFTHGEAIAAALSTLGNHAYNRIASLEAHRGTTSESSRPPDDLVELRDLSDSLLDRAIQLEELEEKIRDRVLSKWADVIGRCFFLQKAQARGDPADVDAYFARFDAFVGQHGATPLTDCHVDALNSMINAYPSERNRILAIYVTLALRHGFDAQALNYRGWDNLRFHFYCLATCSDDLRDSVAELLDREAGAVGGRFALDLAQTIYWLILEKGSSADWLARLVKIARPRLTRSEDRRLRELVSLALAGQHLFEGASEPVFVMAEDRWNQGAGSGDLALADRAESFGLVRLLLSWCPIDDPRLAPWRARLVDLVAERDPSADGVLEGDSRTLSGAAAICAARFAEMEIAAGLPADDWIGARRTR